jgi:hypothetical protein
VFSARIEERALLNAANRRVFEAFSDIQADLSFPLKRGSLRQRQKIHQRTAVQTASRRYVEVTRNRPCHMNDNGYAERKIYDAGRKTAGYFRFDTA